MRLSSWSLGIVLIVVVALIWSASSVLVQAIFTAYDFNRPFFLTYLANSLFIVMLPVRALSRCMRRAHASAASPASLSDAWEATETPDCHGGTSTGGGSDAVPLRQTARAALIVCPLWFMANFTYNWSLGMTSVTSSTVISSSSAAFTLLFSVYCLGEPLTLLKLFGVLLCWVGNGLTAVGDQGDGPAGNSSGIDGNAPPAAPPAASSADPVLGDLICLFSAFMYGVYTTAIRHFAPSDMALFFGLLGSFNMVLLGPIVLALHLSGVESLVSLALPVLGLIVLKGLADNVLSDYLWAWAVLLTSPSVATVGLSLTIPMAALSQLLLPAEWLVDASPPGAYTIAACACVILGFVLLNLASQPRAGADPHMCHRALRVPLLRAPRGLAREAAATGAEVEAEAEAGPARGCRPPHQLPSDRVMVGGAAAGERT